MTTIAYKGGIIACDSRASTDGGTIMSDRRDKCITHHDWRIWFAGADHLRDELLDAWPSGEMSRDDWEALAALDGQLYVVGTEGDGQIFFARHDPDEPVAMGSGCDHAITAMDMGCSAEQAVEMASLRDSHTGGTIRTYEVDNGPA